MNCGEHNKTGGCQASPTAPKLCANDCGFFGSAATMKYMLQVPTTKGACS
jgi:hypothetical protein